jgi:hypothetical protein
MEHPEYPEYPEYAEYRGPQRTSPDALIEMSPAMMPSHGLTLPHCGIDTQLPSPHAAAAIALGLPPTGTPAQRVPPTDRCATAAGRSTT